MSKLILAYRVGFGLVTGVTAGVIVYMVYRQRHRIGNQKKTRQNGFHVHVTSDRPLSATYSQALSAGADLVAVSRGEPVELLNRLDYVLGSITELRQEIESLRNVLHGLAEEIVGEVRSHLEENQRANRRRRYLPPRERTDSTGSSSIYFTTSSGFATTDAESEGGYTTANAESDYDRESSRASEEEEDEVSCETVRTVRRDSDVVTDEEGEETMLGAEPIDEELALLLQKSDTLHVGDDEQKREGFQLLCSNRLLYGSRQDFLWRLARSYCDMCDITEDLLEKKSYALEGKEEVGIALENEGQSAECHKWFAILCGHSAEHEGIQKRIQTGYIFREHIEKAIRLQPNDPQCYYLLGRWCYEVSNLGWLERKTASALYDTPPSATVGEALENLLKAEELSPGFSKALRVNIAKCYRDLGNQSEAARWLILASELPERTQEDKKMASTIQEMMSVITA